MNFQALLQQTSSNSDYRRLVQLCTSYGLNEQQTNQIINDFKNGSFVQQDQSIDQSFQQSLKQLDSNHCTQNFRNHNQHVNKIEDCQDQNQNQCSGQQYSFKHQKNTDKMRNTDRSRQGSNRHGLSGHQSFEQDSRRFGRQNNFGLTENILEQFMNQRRQFEKNIYHKLQTENEKLKQEMKQKQQKIAAFIKLKMQDSDIIYGLKQTISNLTNQLQQKQQSYKLLLQRYEKVKFENQTISTQKNSKIQQISHYESVNSNQQKKSNIDERKNLNSFQQRRSIIQQKSSNFQERKSNVGQQRRSLIREKQNCLTETDLNKLYKKSSQKYIKQVSGRNSIKALADKSQNFYQNRQNIAKNQQNKRSGIDINKYKGMIEKLRNSYQFR